ncbi:lipoxygenase homology domain-containing protein 1-like [Callorhinchus milii]|uniref:lipoxygenase homology domain-containing protein 1-like n=1 Tax=Callorhinchus milii TaxID=7868 RepID=UPI001C3F8538|nr:lipoxygenase homology domain-containing protein 1-like [Callorhinchus milii]
MEPYEDWSERHVGFSSGEDVGSGVPDKLLFFEDVGDIYKIRINYNTLGKGFEKWHLMSIVLKDLHVDKTLLFDCDTWLSTTSEDRQLIKEFPLTVDGKAILPVNDYFVSVHIGDCWGAETFANVFATLYGERGDSGRRNLTSPTLFSRNKFQQGEVDTFMVEAVSLSKLTKMIVGHDGKGYGAGMYLKMITVKEGEDSEKEWVFPCWKWLDDHIGDKKILEENCGHFNVNVPAGERLVSISDIREDEKSGVWQVNIKGSQVLIEGDPIELIIIIYGIGGQKKLIAPIVQPTSQIMAELGALGMISKIHVSPEPNTLRQPWRLDSIIMKHVGSNEELWFDFHLWLRHDGNQHQFKELPALHPIIDPLPVVEYKVDIYTGNVNHGAIQGTFYIIVHGEKGDTGKRWLKQSAQSEVIFDPGQTATFIFKAVDLGRVQYLTVGYSSLQDWFLEKITVVEGALPISTYTFSHDDWIVKHEKEDTYSETIIHLQEAARNFPNPMKDYPSESQGNWIVWLHTMEFENLTEKQIISLIVFGKNNKSVSLPTFDQKDEPFEISLEDIGEIIKVSLVLEFSTMTMGLKLLKLRMKHMDTNQELGFSIRDRWLFEQNANETVTELAAITPHKQPLQDVYYTLYIWTGNLLAAGTDAPIYITIYGENGDTSKRKLQYNDVPTLFDKGQINVFSLRAIDLSIPEKIHIGHDSLGYGAGWYLEMIYLEEPTENGVPNVYVFPCQQWLDSEVDSKDTKKQLNLVGKVSNKTDKMIASLQVKDYIFFVTTKSQHKTNPSMYVTLKGSLGVTGKLKLTKQSSEMKKALVSMYRFQAINVGQLQELYIEIKHTDIYPKQIVVRDGVDSREEAVFESQDTTEAITERGGTLRTFKCKDYQKVKDIMPCPEWPQIKKGGKWNVLLIKVCSEEPPAVMYTVELEMVIYGAAKHSKPIALTSTSSDCEQNVTFEVNVPDDIGKPWKIRLGLANPSDNISQIKLRYFKMQNVITKAAFNYSVNETLPVSSNGDRWVEFPVEWPQKTALSVVTYNLKMYCDDFLDKDPPIVVSLCLYGENGDTGERNLLKPIGKQAASEDRKFYVFQIFAVQLGKMNKLELSANGIKNDKFHVNEVYVSEATQPKKRFVFALNENILVIPKNPVIRIFELSGVINDEREESENLKKHLVEYAVKVYTEDQFGPNTDVNMYIILFGDEAVSNRVPLTETIDFQEPFKKKHVDQFRIETNPLGKLYLIEIGYGKQNPRSGWFLGKVEVTDVSTKETYVFPGNRNSASEGVCIGMEFPWISVIQCTYSYQEKPQSLSDFLLKNSLLILNTKRNFIIDQQKYPD